MHLGKKHNCLPQGSFFDALIEFLSDFAQRNEDFIIKVVEEDRKSGLVDSFFSSFYIIDFVDFLLYYGFVIED